MVAINILQKNNNKYIRFKIPYKTLAFGFSEITLGRVLRK